MKYRQSTLPLKYLIMSWTLSLHYHRQSNSGVPYCRCPAFGRWGWGQISMFWQLDRLFLLGRIPVLSAFGIDREVNPEDVLSIKWFGHALNNYGLGFLCRLCRSFKDYFIVDLFPTRMPFSLPLPHQKSKRIFNSSISTPTQLFA